MENVSKKKSAYIITRYADSPIVLDLKKNELTMYFTTFSEESQGVL